LDELEDLESDEEDFESEDFESEGLVSDFDPESDEAPAFFLP
jgi:hypothetical protein